MKAEQTDRLPCLKKKKQTYSYLTTKTHSKELVPLDLDLLSLLIKSCNRESGSTPNHHSDVLPTGSMLGEQGPFSYYMDQVWNQISHTQCKLWCLWSSALPSMWPPSFLQKWGNRAQGYCKAGVSSFPSLGGPTLGNSFSDPEDTIVFKYIHARMCTAFPCIHGPLSVCLNCYCEHSIHKGTDGETLCRCSRSPLK